MLDFLLDLANIFIGGVNKTVNEYSNAKKTGQSVNKYNVAMTAANTAKSSAKRYSAYVKQHNAELIAKDEEARRKYEEENQQD